MYTDLPTLKELAEDVTAKAGVWGQIPVPLERIVDSLRYVAVTFADSDELADVAGAIRYDERTIYVNGKDAVRDQRFTLAHEIGHAVLHEGESIVDYRRDMDTPRDRREIEANKFAVELTMPEAEFREVWLTRRANVARVAAYFGMGEDAVEYRASGLGLPRSY